MVKKVEKQSKTGQKSGKTAYFIVSESPDYIPADINPAWNYLPVRIICEKHVNCERYT